MQQRVYVATTVENRRGIGRRTRSSAPRSGSAPCFVYSKTQTMFGGTSTDQEMDEFFGAVRSNAVQEMGPMEQANAKRRRENQPSSRRWEQDHHNHSGGYGQTRWHGNYRSPSAGPR